MMMSNYTGFDSIAKAEMHFSVDSPTAFAGECGISFMEQKPFFTEARKMLKTIEKMGRLRYSKRS